MLVMECTYMSSRQWNSHSIQCRCRFFVFFVLSFLFCHCLHCRSVYASSFAICHLVLDHCGIYVVRKMMIIIITSWHDTKNVCAHVFIQTYQMNKAEERDERTNFVPYFFFSSSRHSNERQNAFEKISIPAFQIDLDILLYIYICDWSFRKNRNSSDGISTAIVTDLNPSC